MASIGNGKPDAEGQPPQPERLAASLPPPADVPPPHTEAGRVVLLDVLRRRVEGFPTWMLPRYVVHGVDVYGFHPDNLLRCHPLATSPDGKRACYFLNQIRPLTARDPRRSRVAPGGFWKSERAPVPVEAAPGRIVGTNQSFSFISKEAEDKGGLRGGFLMHELLLPGQAGRLAGGEELALSKIYPSPRVDKKRSQGEGSIGSATRSAAASSAPTSSPRSSNVFSITRSSTAASSAPTSSPRSSDVFSITRSSRAASSPPPSLEAPASSTPPSLEASSLGLQGPASSAPGPASSSPPPIQGAASSQTSPRHRQGAAKRVLLLEVGNSPPREGNNFSCHQVYRALEVLGPGRRVPIDCGDLFLLDCDNAKRQRTAAEF